MQKKNGVFFSATKGMNPWDVNDNTGWQTLGNNSEASEIDLVPTVADCVEELAKSTSDLPFSVYDEQGQKVDDSDDYKNVTGAIPNPSAFLWLTAASLVTFGAAYWGKALNPAGYTKKLKYYAPPNIRPEILPETSAESLQFTRANNSGQIPANQVLYIWLSDPYIEFGPPSNYPMRRAEKSAGAVSAVNEFVRNYMQSGMVRAFIAQSDTSPGSEDERNQMEDYLTRILTGIRRAITRIRVLKKSVEIKAIGGGLDEIKNVAVIREIKKDILESFGVPESRVWGNAANFATAANDTVVFITSEIMPLARCIEGALNEQIFSKYGYKFVFEPRRLEEFSVLLSEKIKLLEPITKAFGAVMKPAAALKAAINIAGIELSPEVISAIDAQIIAENKPPVVPAPVIAPIEQAPKQTDEENSVDIKALVELDRWRAKCQKAGTLVTWHAVDLSASVIDAIKSGATWEQARAMIVSGNTEQRSDEVKALAESINELADAMKAKPETKALEPILQNQEPTQITIHNYPQAAPIVTVNTPDMPAPIVTVNVPETIVNVNQPIQPAPVVNVTNDVQPSPVQVVMPPPQNVKIKRDNNGVATGLEAS